VIENDKKMYLTDLGFSQSCSFQGTNGL